MLGRNRRKQERAVVYTGSGRHVTRWPGHAALIDALNEQNAETPAAKAFFVYADTYDGDTYLVNVMQANIITTEVCSRPKDGP